MDTAGTRQGAPVAGVQFDAKRPCRDVRPARRELGAGEADIDEFQGQALRGGFRVTGAAKGGKSVMPGLEQDAV